MTDCITNVFSALPAARSGGVAAAPVREENAL
jgi:hypothetical protein